MIALRALDEGLAWKEGRARFEAMDGARAAWGCRRFFDFEAVIPAHYKTFPLLEQSADGFAQAAE